MPPYEDVIRPFRVDAKVEFTDVWTFPNVRPYKGKHPAEKPASLLELAIAATTYEGDIVLDCFGGSGSTALAAVKLNRRAVSIEIEPHWVQHSLERMGATETAQIIGIQPRLTVRDEAQLRKARDQMSLSFGAK